MEKRFAILALAMSVVIFATSCGTAPAAGGPAAATPTAPQRHIAGVPAFVTDWIVNAPEGVIVGVGTGNFPTVQMGLQMSQNRALIHIATQLGTFARNMVTDYMAASEVTQDAVGFSETVARTLTEQRVTGTRTVGIDQDANGTWWAVVVLDRTVANTTVQEAMHNLNPSFAAAMGGLDRMDRAFAELNAEPLVPIAAGGD